MTAESPMTAESSGMFERCLGTDGPLDLSRMNVEQLTAIGLTAVMLDSHVESEGDREFAVPYARSFETALGVFCSDNAYERQATTIARSCATSKDPRARVYGAILYGLLQRSHIPQRRSPGDGQAEAAIWEHLMQDETPYVSMHAFDEAFSLVEYLSGYGREDLAPVADAILAVLRRRAPEVH